MRDKRVRVIVNGARRELERATTTHDLEQVRVRYLGKKGLLTQLLRSIPSLPPAERPVVGREANAAKAEIESRRPGAPTRRLFRWLNFGLLLGHPRLLALAASAARLYQASGLQRLARRTGLIRLLPGTLPAWDALLPPVPSRSERVPPPSLTPAEGSRRARVALLTGCVQSIVFGAHNRATARVLAKNGCEVIVPEGQGCCGALNAHGGDHARAVEMARRTIDTFEATGADAVIVNTSGCGAHMKAYGYLLADDAFSGCSVAFTSRQLFMSAMSSVFSDGQAMA